MTEKILCPACDMEMPYEPVKNWALPVEVTWANGSRETLDLQKWYVFKCLSCGTPLVYSSWDGEEPEPVFPSRKLSALVTRGSLPNLVSEDLKETEICYQAKLFNAFGAMARRTLHSICADFGSKKSSLYKQIKELQKNETFSEEVSARAHAIRTLGRNGSHPEWEPVTQQMADDALLLLHWLIENLYPLNSEPPGVPNWATSNKRRY